MNDPQIVRRNERRSDLSRDGHRALERQRAPGDDPVERHPRHVLQHEEVGSVVELTEVGGRGDVRVLHVRARDGLALKT